MNKYERWYHAIIDKARQRELSIGEVHHILPRSLGGDNSKANKVVLTPKEHFMCHLLLTKFTHGKDRMKMCKALWMMKGRSNKVFFSSKMYNDIRMQCKRLASENSRRMWANTEIRSTLIALRTGRKNTSDTLKLMSESARRRHTENPLPVETRRLISDKLRGRRLTDAEKEKRRLAASKNPKPKVTCPWCLMSGGKPVMARYHFDNCKKRDVL